MGLSQSCHYPYLASLKESGLRQMKFSTLLFFPFDDNDVDGGDG